MKMYKILATILNVFKIRPFAKARQAFATDMFKTGFMVITHTSNVGKV
jgi:hypothetical protein